jgi:hypothetical protein
MSRKHGRDRQHSEEGGTIGTMSRFMRVFSGAALTALVWAPLALAQDPTGRGYGGSGGDIQGRISGSGPGGSGVGGEVAGNSSNLPFTGLDLALFLAAGLVLVLIGATLRRAAREKA